MKNSIGAMLFVSILIRSFKEIDTAILESVHYVVNLQREEKYEKFSILLKMEEME